jgi:hypothetical protein
LTAQVVYQPLLDEFQRSTLSLAHHELSNKTSLP